jgi:hypothetical protein
MYQLANSLWGRNFKDVPLTEELQRERDVDAIVECSDMK